MKNSTTKRTPRTVIRGIINREKCYSLADYSRKIFKITGREYTKSEVVSCLGHMSYEGQVTYVVSGRIVIGCLTKVA